MEESSARGRADMVVHTGRSVFVPEFRVVQDRSGADAEPCYAEKYMGAGNPVHRLAVVCGREERNILEIRAETA